MPSRELHGEQRNDSNDDHDYTYPDGDLYNHFSTFFNKPLPGMR
jgi:hypothetical protein